MRYVSIVIRLEKHTIFAQKRDIHQRLTELLQEKRPRRAIKVNLHTVKNAEAIEPEVC